MTFVSYFLTFIFGLMLGSYIRGIAFDSQEWKLLRWDSSIFGYRNVALGTTLYRGDKIIMGLQVNSDSLPKEGLKYTQTTKQDRG